jgi:hypothetical protein
MAHIELDHVTKVYPGGVPAVDDLSLDIGDGDFMVLVGPSGSGKSTALRMVAGLEEVTSGEIRIGDRVVNDLPSRDRDIAMVFQNYALYPNMTVEENLAFGLRVHKTPKDEQRRRVAEAACLGLADDRPPHRHPLPLDPGGPQALTGADQGAGLAWLPARGRRVVGRLVELGDHDLVLRAIDLAVDTSALYWSDPDSGQAIARQSAGDRHGSIHDAMPPAAVA